MTKKQIKKAIELQEDIENIESVLEESKKRHWIKVLFHKGLKIIYPYKKASEIFYSVRFQEELAEWLEQKLIAYQKELDEM